MPFCWESWNYLLARSLNLLVKWDSRTKLLFDRHKFHQKLFSESLYQRANSDRFLYLQHSSTFWKSYQVKKFSSSEGKRYFFSLFFGRIVWLSQCVTEASVVVSRAHWSESNPSRLAIHQASFDRPPTRHASTLTRTHTPHSKLNEHKFITYKFRSEKIRSISNWHNVSVIY